MDFSEKTYFIKCKRYYLTINPINISIFYKIKSTLFFFNKVLHLHLQFTSIKITFDKKLFNLNQIEISGIWGYGNYEITIFTEKEQININNLQLFNKNNEKLSLIILEI